MSDKKKILILGAGYGGVHVAKKLAKKYKKNNNVEITLIDKNPFHTLMTELHEVAGGRVHPESVQIELSKIFARTKVNVVTDLIEKVDTDNKTVKTTNGNYTYDYLVVGTGSEPAFFGVPGVKENGFTLWSFEDAMKIRHHVQKSEPAFFGVPGVKENGFTLWSFEDAMKIRHHVQKMFKLAAKERNEAKRREMLTFVVAGSGFTGIEMAGELLEWKTRLAKEHNVDENEVRLMVVEAMGTILNMLDRKQADKAEKYMVKKGMTILKNSPIVEVAPNKIVLKSGEEIETNTLIWTCGIQANEEVKEYGLETARAGRLATNEFMQAVNKEEVFVVGDLNYYEEEEGKGTPQIVEAAIQTGDVIAKNIIALMDKKKDLTKFKSNYHGFMVSIGGKYCVANLAGIMDKKKDLTKFKSNYHGFMVSIGGKYCVANLAGIKLAGFFAMIMKHLVNLHYLWGVNNVNACYHYLQHEFFSMEDNRCIMRGHLSSKSNRLWLVPLRLYIGVLWLLEGLKKFVGEGTWENHGIKALFNGNMVGGDSWLKAGNIKMPFAWLQTAADSGASASGEATTEFATPILEKMPKFYEAIMQIFIPNPEIAD